MAERQKSLLELNEAAKGNSVVSKLKCPVYVASEMCRITESDLALTEGARRATEVSAREATDRRPDRHPLGGVAAHRVRPIANA